MTKILNNIVLFPGVENNKLKEIENDLLITQKKIKSQMNFPDYDLIQIDKKDIITFAEYGDVMFFDTFTARRLISCLATRIVEQENIINDLSESQDD